jgi:UDP-GlcNAc:undecaprenyl-phosphate GlcNAc-1-phosphate transferase
MTYLLVLITATAISLAVVPLMVHLAPRLGMMDLPNSRKVHLNPIPRVGGVGIVAGSIITILIWAPKNELLISYVLGSLILLLFGIWDDRRDLGPNTKFLGQFIAAMLAILFGNLYVTSFPFMSQPLPEFLGGVFTLFSMIGVINAVNTSDGLDGLAGGLSILSFAVVVLLAYFVDVSNIILIIAIAAIGGTFGFLRYNTHPATVFMGDGGSQFLGYNLAFMVIVLTQKVDVTLSPIIVLFILGLPVVDIVYVMIHRARAHLPLFRATNDHLHHRLLRLNFIHKETVIIIYSLQFAFVLIGIYFRYGNEWLITVLYLGLCSAIYAIVYLAENKGWRAHQNQNQMLDRLEKNIKVIGTRKLLIIMPRRFLEFIIPIYLITVSLWVNEVPKDFGMVAAILTVFVIPIFVFIKQPSTTLRRILIYTTAAFVVFLSYKDRFSWGDWVLKSEIIFFSLVTLAIAVAIRFAPGRRKEEFRTTAMDYLLVLVIISGVLISQIGLISVDASVFLVQLVIILYACEFLFVERRERVNWLSPSLLPTLAIITLRGLDIIDLKLRFVI